MHRRRFLAAAGLALLFPGTATASDVATAYYVVRHLHTPAGERDPDLTDEGRRHALALAERLAGEGIGAIYVSDYKRTRQTAGPLAARLKIVPTAYDAGDTPALLAKVRAERRPVLVVGHSNTVPDIVEGLGGIRPAPLVHEDYGDLWRIAPGRETLRLRLDAGRPDAVRRGPPR